MNSLEGVVKNEKDLDVFPKCVEDKNLQYRSEGYCCRKYDCGEFCDYLRIKDKKQVCEYYEIKRNS